MFDSLASAAGATTSTPTTTSIIQNGPNVSYETWLAALASSACIGFTSLVPWLFNMTFFEQRKHQLEEQQTGTDNLDRNNNEDYRMKFLLSFAVGAILGDIFFHLIPESIQSHIVELNDLPDAAYRKVGESIIAGIFMFIIVEMLLEKWSHSMTDDVSVKKQVGIEKEELYSSAINRETRTKRTRKENVVKTNQKNDLSKQAIGALINYFEENDKLEKNNNFAKNLNFHINNNNNHHHHQDIIHRRKETINNDNISSLNTNKINNNNNNNSEQSVYQTIKETDNQLKSRKISESSTKQLTINNNGTTFNYLDQDWTKEENDNQQFEDQDDEELDRFAKSIEPVKTSTKKHQDDDRTVEVAGYLSLIANGFDNFTHGLAIGASFLVGPKVGLLTTFVIFIHEIPHEICDYAILVNSGFSRWDAVKAQSSVSLFGILGTATALYVKSIETLTAKTCWILPFSAGGFLYIALVNILPEILDHRTSFIYSTGQIACVILGIAFMAIVGVM